MKKSLYIFLSSIMGALLFLILHQIIVFLYSVALSTDYADLSFGFSYMEFVAFEYLTLIFVLLAGAWYGIWLGLYWYEKVYEEGSHGGGVNHVASNYFPRSKKNFKLEAKMEAVKKDLETNLWELEDLAKTA